uniref:Arrestin C-terminal-like domain-containing protein n=1 Tax=Romanomermis culicivorax TaxID=13658 RepID=A0A915KGX7_ROMCU
MVKITALDIEFENPYVFAGQWLQGFVVFDVGRKPQRVKNLTLRLNGKTKVAWPAGATIAAESSKEIQILDEKLDLSPFLARIQLNNNGKLPPGVHKIPFAYILPPDLPSSFGGDDKFGYVCYTAKVNLENSHKISWPFTIVGIEDLNWHPYAALPVTFKEQSSAPSFWSLFNRWTTSGSSSNDAAISLVLQIERTAFVPGESVRLNAEVLNRSNKKIKNTCVHLRQGILYKTSQNSKRKREIIKVIAQNDHCEIHPGGVDRWEWEELKIPLDAPPSFMRGSPLITIKYDLIFTVDQTLITLIVPIIIGTVPFLPGNLRTVQLKALPWSEQQIYEHLNCNAAGQRRSTANSFTTAVPVQVNGYNQKSNGGNLEQIYADRKILSEYNGVNGHCNNQVQSAHRRVIKIEEID